MAQNRFHLQPEENLEPAVAQISLSRVKLTHVCLLPPQHPHSKRQATDSTDSSDSYHLRSHMGSPACVPRFTSSSSIIQRLGRTRTHKQQQLPPPPPSRAPPITPNIVCALDSERPPRPVNAELQLILVA